LSGRTPFAPFLLHDPNIPPRLRAVDKLAAFGLFIAFLDVRAYCATLFVGPAFLSILRFKGAAQHVLGIGICAAGKPFVNQCFKIRRNIELRGRSSVPFSILAFERGSAAILFGLYKGLAESAPCLITCKSARMRTFYHSLLQAFLICASARAQNTVYSASTLAGQARPTGDGGLATGALLNRPAGLCYDSAGNLYIADQEDFRVRKIDTSGKITTIAGTGTYGYTGDGGPATSALIGTPQGLAVDTAGNLYISDSIANVVRMVTPAGIISTFAGNGTAGYSGNNGPATSASLNGPDGLAVDAAGNLYIADTGNNRVRKVSGGIITLFAGSGVDSLSASTGTAATLPLSTPAGLMFDSAGNLYVSSVNYVSVMKITSGGTMSLFAGHGYSGFSDGDNGPAASAHFLSPVALAADANGNLYVADDVAQVVRKINSGGQISGLAGSTNMIGFSGDGGSSTTAMFFSPSGLAVDKSGNVLISDSNNNRIRKVDPVGLTINTFAGSAAALGDGGAATSAQLLSPGATAMDAAGNVYIADTLNNRIRKIDTSGKASTFAGTGIPGFSGDGLAATSAQMLLPVGVSVDIYGDVLIADSGNNRIRKVAPNGNISTIAGTGVYNYAGDGGPATSAALANPECVRSDASGNLYIADTDNDRIRRINGSGIISTIAGGNGASYGDGGPAISAQLAAPACVAVDASNNVYIADTFHSAIRKVDTTANISTVAGNTRLGFAGDSGQATGATLFWPSDVVPDANGNFFIADTVNARIRKVAANGIITSIAGTGAFGATGDGGPSLTAQIGEVVGLSIDPAGNLYLADSYNNRVRKLTAMAGPAPDFAFTQDASSKNVTTGSTVAFSLAIASQNGFAGTVAVAVTGLTGGTVSYAPSGSVTVAAGQTVTIMATIAIPGGAATGSQSIGFTATSGTLTHNLSETLVVTAAGPPAPVISSAGVANGASFAGGAVAPGEIVTIYGSGFGPASIATLQVDSNSKVVSTLAGTTATFNGVPAPVIYVIAGQMSVVVPYEVAGSSSATLQVTYNGASSNSVTVPVTDAVPALFTYNASGSGPLAAANQDGSVNTAANPAAMGSVMVFFGTGEGQTAPAGVDGQVASNAFPKPLLPVSATIGGMPATVLYYGAAPGDVAGAFQLNVMVPTGITTGPAVPVTFTVGTKTSQPGVAIAVH
jgi:trimeric autotransporter adhesin